MGGRYVVTQPTSRLSPCFSRRSVLLFELVRLDLGSFASVLAKECCTTRTDDLYDLHDLHDLSHLSWVRSVLLLFGNELIATM